MISKFLQFSQVLTGRFSSFCWLCLLLSWLRSWFCGWWRWGAVVGLRRNLEFWKVFVLLRCLFVPFPRWKGAWSSECEGKRLLVGAAVRYYIMRNYKMRHWFVHEIKQSFPFPLLAIGNYMVTQKQTRFFCCVVKSLIPVKFKFWKIRRHNINFNKIQKLKK